MNVNFQYILREKLSSRLPLCEPLLCLAVGVEGAYVEATGSHGPGVHHGVLHHVVGQVAWGILAAAVVYGVANEGQVVPHIYIERWYGPVALGLTGLLLHAEHAHLGVYLDDARSL